jgi:hypothetical protein
MARPGASGSYSSLEEWPNVMMELKVTLDFACHACEQSVSVTLQCSGKGLIGEIGQAVAAVNVPCPHCGQVSQLFFDPQGAVREVRPYFNSWPVPLPSLN